MKPAIEIDGRTIGPGAPVYIVAELSANHHQSLEEAEKLVRAARECGADAIKLQTYTADTITLDSDQPWFRIGKGSAWEGKTLHGLYGEAFTPWEWHPRLQELAGSLGMSLFSTPFDFSAVDFLESHGAPAYKIASFELVDLPLIRRVAATKKPLIMSTGMATEEEIEEALDAARQGGADEVVLLKCTSSYPADPREMNLRAIADMPSRFGTPAGLSDHTMGLEVPVAAVALGACVIEKHLTLSRAAPGPDSGFSLEPEEFRQMVAAVRTAEQALGTVRYGPTASEEASRSYRRSLFVVRDVRAGEVFTDQNVRSIRPGHGLHTRHLEEVIGRRATRDVARGTPLDWTLVDRG